MKYICDDGKVRDCAVNIAKMNVLEYIYYSIFHWGYLQNSIYKIFIYALKLVEEIFKLGLEIIKLIAFPVFIIIYAILHIKKNKKWVENFNI